MDAILFTLVLAFLLSAVGTIISLSLRLRGFAHRSGQTSRPRSARRVYLAPGNFVTDTNLTTGDSEIARYTWKTIATLIILLVILSTLIYGAFHALVAF